MKFIATYNNVTRKFYEIRNRSNTAWWDWYVTRTECEERMSESILMAKVAGPGRRLPQLHANQSRPIQGYIRYYIRHPLLVRIPVSNRGVF